MPPVESSTSSINEEAVVPPPAPSAVKIVGTLVDTFEDSDDSESLSESEDDGRQDAGDEDSDGELEVTNGDEIDSESHKGKGENELETVDLEFLTNDSDIDAGNIEFAADHSTEKSTTSTNANILDINADIDEDLIQSTTKSLSSAGIANAEDDEEFSFAANSSTRDGVPNIQATRDAIKNKQMEEESKILQALKDQTEKERSSIVESIEPSVSHPTSDKVDPLYEADPLQEMHDMYKRGLGDQEIRQSEETFSSMDNFVGVPTIIEEGDEDEEERLEEAEKNEQQLQEEQAQRALVEQEASWETANAMALNNLSATAISQSGHKLVSFEEACQHFRNSDYVKAHINDIVPYERISSGCFSCFGGHQLNFPGATAERDLVFCLAKCKFDDGIPMHYSILQSVYQNLIGMTSSCARTGAHWESIGFQGADPATDLRGVGMLGLLQLLHLLTAHHNFALEFYRLSEDEQRHFPYACVSINITLHCLKALRSGEIYPECNKRQSILQGINNLHFAMCKKLYESYKIRGSQEPFPKVMQSILTEGEKTPLKVLSTQKGKSTNGIAKNNSTLTNQWENIGEA